jgi:asparagine synthase (glutamine-hydrolysing)
MCAISGQINLDQAKIPYIHKYLEVMNSILSHRGPDDEQIWVHTKEFLGLAHRRLSIIDLNTGKQPMTDNNGSWIVLNGEIYNYLELKQELKYKYSFKTASDTEVILAAYLTWGKDCVKKLRGMFAFAIWDETNHKLFCSRDRFGIKPFYYTICKNVFYFASEIKALLPFIDEIETDRDGLKDYLVFQFTLGEKTLFKSIKQLLPAHSLEIKNSTLQFEKYWEVNYAIDWEHTKSYFQNKVRELIEDSVKLHLRSDVPVGAYLSGGLDSSLMASFARIHQPDSEINVFNGKFSQSNDYDESEYAREIAEKYNLNLFEIDITSQDFIDNIHDVIYHLDYPVAGPGSFPQFMVSKIAGKNLKVVLGGQGGDEIFGGYARYLLAYFEQCVKGAIDGSMNSGKFIVTYESIIPNLGTLKEYVPLMKEFWSNGLFDERDKRYFKLVNRANTLTSEINWELLEPYSAFDSFKSIFWQNNVQKESYFDSMTHFDFKTLLPALLHVEDRMSMAHGLESRVPFLDHPLVEFAATLPANIKFENGELKHLLKITFGDIIPERIINRKDKMGFPVPLSDWIKGDLSEFVYDTFSSTNAKRREYLNPNFNIKTLISEDLKFSRKLWGLLSLEIWQQTFHDKSIYYKNLIKE